MLANRDDMASYMSNDEWKATSRVVRQIRRASFEWRIENFSRLPTEGYEKIDSPLFTSFSSKWKLYLYPNGECDEDARKIIIYVNKMQRKPPVKFECRVSVKDKYGVYVVESVTGFRGGYGGHGWACFDRDALMGEKGSEFLPDDVLTVHCEFLCAEDIVHGEVEHVPQQSASKEENTAVATIPKAMEILLKDYEKLLRDEDDSDIILQVGPERFRAHKLLLKARSRVFAAMFKHGVIGTETDVITITDIEQEIMSDLLRYIYAGIVSDMSEDKAIKLYIAADNCCLLELKAQCSIFLQNNLSVDNICNVAIMASTHNDGKLMDFIKTFAREDSSFLNTEKWTHLAEQNPRLAYEILMALVVPPLSNS